MNPEIIGFEGLTPIENCGTWPVSAPVTGNYGNLTPGTVVFGPLFGPLLGTLFVPRFPLLITNGLLF